MQKKFIGFILIFVSTLLLLIKTQSVSLESFITWPFILFFLGLLLLFVAFVKNNDKLALGATLASGLGFFIWGVQSVDGWPDHWSILLMISGIGVLVQYLINKQNLTMVIALVLIISGISAWPGLNEIASLAPIAPTLNTYWPLFLLGLGLYFLARK